MEDTAVRWRSRDEKNGAKKNTDLLLSTAAQQAQLRPPSSGNEPTARNLVQPWKEYWPPKLGDALYSELVSAYPEVLTWKFEPHKLFEQPWRQWASASYADSGSPDITEPYTTNGKGSFSHNAFVDVSLFSRLREDNDEAYAALGLEEGQSTVDHLITELRLEWVCPLDFFYLAALDLYRLEKPFRCQLPKINGYRMSNIATSQHSVRIFNIAGHEDRFILDEAGFQFTKCPITLTDQSDNVVVTEYLPQLSIWLKRWLGCQQVFFYAYNVSWSEM